MGVVVLAGPTLDRAMGLIRVGRLSTTPIDLAELAPRTCVSRPKDLAPIASAAPQDLADLLSPQGAEPVHVFVASAAEAHACKQVKHHVLSSSLPSDSFMRLCDDVLVPSWPLYYVLRCARLKRLSDRLKLGMELCGRYAHLVAGDETTPTFYREANKTGELVSQHRNPRIKQATTVKEIASFCSLSKRIAGLRPAQEAAAFLLDGSASPNESVLGLMMNLPCRKGGYGFGSVSLNPDVPVKSELRHLVNVDTYQPDCYLEAIETDLEFQSFENHLGRRALVRDASRRNDIQTLGIEVKDVTWDTVSHLDKLDLLARQLAHKEQLLGAKGEAAHRRAIEHPDNVAARRTRLMELLPAWPYEQ